MIPLHDFPVVPAISASVVSVTVEKLVDPHRRAIVRHLHWLSHRSGGLQTVAFDLCRLAPDCLGSATMHDMGTSPGEIYAGDAFDRICTELDHFPVPPLRTLLARLFALNAPRFSLPSRLPTSDFDLFYAAERQKYDAQERTDIERMLSPAARHLTVECGLAVCKHQAKDLPHKLVRLCTNADEPWTVPYLRDLAAALAGLCTHYRGKAKNSAASTSILSTIHQGIDYAIRTKQLVVIYGAERIGKSVGLRSAQLAHPDKTRLVELDEAGVAGRFLTAALHRDFYRSMGFTERPSCARESALPALAVAAKQLNVALLVDPPSGTFSQRGNTLWAHLRPLLGQFVDAGVTVVLTLPPAFVAHLRAVGNGSPDAFCGRVGRWVELPGQPDKSDLELHARHLLPGASGEIVDLIASGALADTFRFEAVKRAVAEIRESTKTEDGTGLNTDDVASALGVSLFTTDQLAGIARA